MLILFNTRIKTQNHSNHGKKFYQVFKINYHNQEIKKYNKYLRKIFIKQEIKLFQSRKKKNICIKVLCIVLHHL